MGARLHALRLCPLRDPTVGSQYTVREVGTQGVGLKRDGVTTPAQFQQKTSDKRQPKQLGDIHVMVRVAGEGSERGRLHA